MRRARQNPNWPRGWDFFATEFVLHGWRQLFNNLRSIIQRGESLRPELSSPFEMSGDGVTRTGKGKNKIQT
jgi:hypothetical protein